MNEWDSLKRERTLLMATLHVRTNIISSYYHVSFKNYIFYKYYNLNNQYFFISWYIYILIAHLSKRSNSNIQRIKPKFEVESNLACTSTLSIGSNLHTILNLRDSDKICSESTFPSAKSTKRRNHIRVFPFRLSSVYNLHTSRFHREFEAEFISTSTRSKELDQNDKLIVDTP